MYRVHVFQYVQYKDSLQSFGPVCIDHTGSGTYIYFFEQTSSFQTGGVVQNAGHRLLVQKYVPAGGAAVWYILYNSLTATSPNLSLGH